MSNKKSNSNEALSYLASVVALIIFVGSIWILIPPIKPVETTQLLSREGFSNIKIEGYEWFGCSDDDYYRTKFKATKNNVEANGVVCAGFFKGSTIRFYN